MHHSSHYSLFKHSFNIDLYPSFIHYKTIRSTPENSNTQQLHPYNFNTKKKFSHSWTQREDDLLEKAVEKYGVGQWKIISENVPNRSRKQCRERYCNHLDPFINKEPWTTEEDELLIQLHKQFGNKWSFMKTYFQGRTANTIKNRYTKKFQTKNNTPTSVFVMADTSSFQVDSNF
ncbi:R2r3-MYB transcription factor [Entamoeba marina]